MAQGCAGEDVAAKAEIEPQRLADIEAGRVRATATELFRLAEAMGVSISHFFDGDAG